jgi:UDP-N-acetyl-D-glucosamine dehydrogenase
MPFYPGPGLGGHCIPIDPFYLTWRAKECGQPTRFIELAGQINRRMPAYVVERIAEALNQDAKPLHGSRILILGLAYKPNVDDTRETPAAEIISLLADRGANIRYHDPHVPSFPRKRDYSFELDSVPLSPEILGQADCVVIATDHDAIDWETVGREAKLVVDTRNAMSRVKAPSARIVKA